MSVSSLLIFALLWQLPWLFLLSFEKYNPTFSLNATRPAIFVFSTSKTTEGQFAQIGDDERGGNTPLQWWRIMWVMHLLIKQRSPGIALTWWWTHPGHFPCKKSTFVYGKHLQVQISTIFFQAAYQYFSSGTFYVQGLAPGLPTAVLCIDIANGVRWYGRGSSIRRENQIMLIFLNKITVRPKKITFPLTSFL